LLIGLLIIAGVQMLTLVVPAQIRFLMDGMIPTGSMGTQNTNLAFRRRLHEFCLQRLMKIGLQYREVKKVDFEHIEGRLGLGP